MNPMQPSGEFSWEKNSPPSQITYAKHMTMTTSGQILSLPDYRNIRQINKINVNMKFLDLCESLIVYIVLSTCQ